MVYEIFEGNMERLEKKLKLIQSKCRKYGCEFNASAVGEVFKQVKDETTGEVKTTRFIQVEASGVAKVDDWEFVATIEHVKPTNVIRSFRPEYEVPERYYTADPICEHCNSKRNRKDTYLIRNTETGEFKQVGKSWVGSVGERITLSEANVKLLTSWETMYGYTYMYQFVDKAGNIYIWKTSNNVEGDTVSLKGTVKAHSDFNGVKQTELTRCKVI